MTTHFYRQVLLPVHLWRRTKSNKTKNTEQCFKYKAKIGKNECTGAEVVTMFQIQGKNGKKWEKM